MVDALTVLLPYKIRRTTHSLPSEFRRSLMPISVEQSKTVLLIDLGSNVIR